MFNAKVFLAEFIGTFALVFVGTAAGILNNNFGLGLLGVALAHGLTWSVFIYAYGYISGAHINPAVTFALALKNVVTWGQAVIYWIAQFAGAILAAFLLKTIMATVVEGGTIDAGATVGALTDAAPVWAMVMEAILTFFLVNTFLHTAVGGRGGRFAGWAIGMTLTIAIMAGGPFTGASLNPARTFGPAIFSQPSITNSSTYLIYLFGPLIGATFAVFVYNFLTGSNEVEEEEEEVVVEAVVEEAPVVEKKPRARKAAK